MSRSRISRSNALSAEDCDGPKRNPLAVRSIRKCSRVANGVCHGEVRVEFCEWVAKVRTWRPRGHPLRVREPISNDRLGSGTIQSLAAAAPVLFCLIAHRAGSLPQTQAQ